MNLKRSNTLALLGALAITSMGTADDLPLCFDAEAGVYLLLDVTTSSPVVADINADGIDDILFASDGDIVIRWGGPFDQTPLQTLIAGDDYTAPVVGDENNDGLLDIYVCSVTNARIFYQQSDGTFHSHHLRAQSHSADFGDFNADGRLDLVSLFQFRGAPFVLLISIQNEQGGYFSTALYVVHNSLSVRTGDFNGDGFDDIGLCGLFANKESSGTFAILMNDGTGSFSEYQWFPGGYAGFLLTPFDIDLDDDLDVAVAVYGDLNGPSEVKVDLYINDGNATFTNERLPFPINGGSIGRGQDFADVDGDGVPDFLVSIGYVFYVFHGTTPGSFEQWHGWDDLFDDTHYVEPKFGDFNGDGALDIAVQILHLGAPIDTNEYLLLIPGTCVTLCPGDFDANRVIDVLDLLNLLNNWGPCPGCPSDATGDDVVNISDLIRLLNAWGACG